MRLMTCVHSSESCVERTTRSSVWQPTQLSSPAFCSSVPGILIIHSALVSWPARFLVFFGFGAADSGEHRLTFSPDRVDDRWKDHRGGGGGKCQQQIGSHSALLTKTTACCHTCVAAGDRLCFTTYGDRCRAADKEGGISS